MYLGHLFATRFSASGAREDCRPQGADYAVGYYHESDSSCSYLEGSLNREAKIEGENRSLYEEGAQVVGRNASIPEDLESVSKVHERPKLLVI